MDSWQVALHGPQKQHPAPPAPRSIPEVVLHNTACGGWRQSAPKTGLRGQLPHSRGRVSQPPTLETCPAHKHISRSPNLVSQRAGIGASGQLCPTTQKSTYSPQRNTPRTPGDRGDCTTEPHRTPCT